MRAVIQLEMTPGSWDWYIIDEESSNIEERVLDYGNNRDYHDAAREALESFDRLRRRNIIE